jgi:FtsP/CotA-like multicopper oxidase with cupredoxin domain
MHDSDTRHMPSTEAGSMRATLNRSTFLLGTAVGAAAATGLLLFAGGRPAEGRGQAAQHRHEGGQQPAHDAHTHKHDHGHTAAVPVGSARDRGKLVAGLRGPGLPPVPVVTPDLPRLHYKMVDGFKEFHLHVQPVKRELLPGTVMNFWGYNGTMPGPTVEAVEGDKVRFVVHNHLPEATTLHLHGLELPNGQDGVPGVTQDPIPPGKTGVCELTLHQNGTFFYHSHDPMQEVIGTVGLFIIHPRVAHEPPVDYDFALITQEFRIRPAVNTPANTLMDFNWFTINGRSGPYATPLVVKLGSRVRIRFLNFSTDDHHPMHLHGNTFWVTGTEGGRIPESAWWPGNTVLVGVAQVREVEFVANNPGDWVLHCHMFHHMMNHMIAGVGPASRGQAKGPLQLDPRYKIPGYPQMTGMHAMMSPEQVKKLNANPLTRGMAPEWFMHLQALHTVVRVLPEELYNRVVSGKGDIPAGASVPGGSFGGHDHMHMHH